MYLKRLEIVGFKSFADKIRLDFMPGITAVVGPNGSGKSNISDALRWVLGEQSIKNLRGSKMDDVIFAGSELRKPLSLAEVTIVLDNSDNSIPIEFNEVSITRKLFRSGESEYLINKSPVRLRDIHELFYDTGIGKEAYSVIGQGKIDSILSARAEERRLVFEEAAGIIKYKTRKQTAERKLEETDHNLVRLRDILAELDAQLGPLKVQANLAEEFLKIKEELTKVEINHYGVVISELEEKLDQLNKNKAETEGKFLEFENQENILESALEELRLELLTKDENLAKLNEDYFRIQNQIDKFLEQVSFLKIKLDDLDKQEVECQRSTQTSEDQKNVLSQQTAELDQALEKIKIKLGEAQAELTETIAVLAGKNEELLRQEQNEQNLKDLVIDDLKEIAALKNRANSASLQKDFILKQIGECQKKYQFLEEQFQNGQAELETKGKTVTELASEVAVCHQEQADLAQQLIELEEEQASITAKNLDWKERIRGLESKTGLLEEMERGFQGYFQGVKVLLAETAGLAFAKGIKGIVADLVKVEPGLELAIETALGSSLQNVVIDNDQHAQEAITYLKKNFKGRATFLPLNLVHTPDSKLLANQSLLQQFSCRAAVSVLQCDPIYRQIVNYLLGQTVVAPDLKTAIAIAAKLEKNYRIVTPEGDLVNPGGAITGGSVDKRRLGLLSRRREIEELKKERQESTAFLEKGLVTEKTLKERHVQIGQRLETVKKREQEINLAKIALERELQSLRSRLEKDEREISLYKQQIEELNQESQGFETGKLELAREIEAKEAELGQTQEQLNGLAVVIQDLKEAKESVLLQVTELKTHISASEQEAHGKLALKEQLKQQASASDKQQAEISRKTSQLQLEKEQTSEKSATLNGQIVQEQTRLGEQERLINQCKLEKDEVLVRIKEFEGKQRSSRRKNNEFQNQMHRLDLNISQTSSQIENIQANLVEDYGTDWSNRLDAFWEEPGNAELLIEEFKNQLKELGPVNLGAIDDCQQVEQRFQFLTSQAEDLVKARETLEKVITEIERTITKRFAETIQLINVRFKKIFGELFEGGNADLYLLDNEKPLESGIEIVAQPPGKKLQSLSLLSGGERAMTAVALLFAILDVKPSPFCILDEIDATLDEVNVHRFAQLLEIFSKDLQFIVVTHRRGTMEVANAMYGVTMEELGVSKLISLDLKSKAG